MKIEKVKCTRNESKSFKFIVGQYYWCEDLPGGVSKIYSLNDEDCKIIAPLEGHYLTFEKTKK